MAAEELTAQQLADLTGVPAGTLRVWESRYGFPVPIRMTNHRKRYHRDHVDQVKAVLAHRGRGLSLSAAIERARAVTAPVPRSLFAALRGTRPDIPVRVFPKRLMIALSRAIEDEHAARATGGLLLGSFQRERHYRASERRWRELARTADLTIVLADFPALRQEAGAPVEVPLERSHPLEREWAVVLHSPSASACLAAWEVPAAQAVPEADRTFEFLWSLDPGAAHAVVIAAATILAGTTPELAPTLLAAPVPDQVDPRFSDDLTGRAFAYLAAASS